MDIAKVQFSFQLHCLLAELDQELQIHNQIQLVLSIHQQLMLMFHDMFPL